MISAKCAAEIRVRVWGRIRFMVEFKTSSAFRDGLGFWVMVLE